MKFYIKEAREAAHISQAQLAAKLGINATTLSGYETGKHDPKSDTLILIAKICDTTVDYLLGRENHADIGPSPEALSIACSYDSLDPHGKRIVDAVVSLESERCGNSAPTAEELQKRAIHGANLSEKSV